MLNHWNEWSEMRLDPGSWIGMKAHLRCIKDIGVLWRESNQLYTCRTHGDIILLPVLPVWSNIWTLKSNFNIAACSIYIDQGLCGIKNLDLEFIYDLRPPSMFQSYCCWAFNQLEHPDFPAPPWGVLSFVSSQLRHHQLLLFPRNFWRLWRRPHF